MTPIVLGFREFMRALAARGVERLPGNSRRGLVGGCGLGFRV